MNELLIGLLTIAMVVMFQKRDRKVDDYNKYLKTKHWKKKRAKALKRYGNKCALCGSTYHLQVHHNNYKCLYREKMTDLVVLCEKHHKMVHNIKN